LQHIRSSSHDCAEGPVTVSVILPVMNETWSLEESVRILVGENRERLKEILIITSPRTEKTSLCVIEQLLSLYPSLLRIHQQTLPYLGGAMREAFALAQGRYTVLMASDLETDPHVVRSLISEIEDNHYELVIASRWLEKKGFQGYSLVKYACNFIFQKIFSLLYRVSLTDLTYGFRIYRTTMIQEIVWEELGHSFLFESLVKPLRIGCRVKEIPAIWVARKEGESQNMRSSYAGYFKIGLKVVFSDPKVFLKACQGN
jgi:glycosyltransferase involved in cell wall biosynthesis